MAGAALADHHRVDGLEPGLYALVRDPGHRESLQASLQPKFAWEKPAGCPDALPLYLLGAGDVKQAAAQLSCGQAIAADGLKRFVYSSGVLTRVLEAH